jgi:thiol-disulfide isomerase/thioredoxin
MKRAFSLVLACGTLAALITLTLRTPMVPANAQSSVGDALGMNSSAARPAAEFPANSPWINVDKPLSLRALRGKVVLLDFWTYGCINCIHILPDLKKLERKYPNELVVIGVHSAKFANESDAATIRQAVLRYNIQHPVVVDQNMRIWDSFGAQAWPSFVVLDTEGKVTFKTAGEGQYNALDKEISKLVTRARRSGKLNSAPLRFALDAAKAQTGDLWFPAEVVASDNRLFIADSNHNRIVITDLQGNTEAVAGSGQAGLKDGAFDEAQFHNPRGLFRDGDMLYVADTENHAIRALDLKAGTVSTIAGNGKQAAWRSTGGVGTKAPLASPWDVLKIDRTLYIAMAGPHQIWKMNLDTKQVSIFAGSGREARLDGSAQNAALAQPSGLATDGKKLFFTDSESSSIRAVDLASGAVTTIAGGGPNPMDLFQFGDIDGRGAPVRLQHPLGIAWNNGTLLISDTYNHKLKSIDAQGTVSTLAGAATKSTAGKADGTLDAARFYEPGGVSLLGRTLYVADTNNHMIRVVDLEAKTVSTLNLKNVPAPLPAEPERPVTPPRDDTVTLQKVVLAPNANGELVFAAQLPANHKLTADTPQKFFARVEGRGAELAMVKRGKFQLPLTTPLRTTEAGEGSLLVNSTIYYCTEVGGLCKTKTLRFRVPYEVRAGGQTKITLSPKL